MQEIKKHFQSQGKSRVTWRAPKVLGMALPLRAPADESKPERICEFLWKTDLQDAGRSGSGLRLRSVAVYDGPAAELKWLIELPFVDPTLL